MRNAQSDERKSGVLTLLYRFSILLSDKRFTKTLHEILAKKQTTISRKSGKDE